MIAAKQAVKEFRELSRQIGRHGVFGTLTQRLSQNAREKHARKRRRVPEGILVLHIVAEFLKCLPDTVRIPHLFQNGKVLRKGGRSAVNRREPLPGHVAHAKPFDIRSVLLCNPLCHDALRFSPQYSRTSVPRSRCRIFQSHGRKRDRRHHSRRPDCRPSLAPGSPVVCAA